MSRIPASITIFRRAERGADLVTQLLLFEYRMARAVVARLYKPLPRAVVRFYRREEKSAAKKKAAALWANEQRLERIIRDPQANATEKTLARMELVALRLPAQNEDAE